MSLLGVSLPPAMIFPRVNFKPHMLHGAPSGTLGLATPSGWMNSELFVSVIEHFIFHSGSSTSNPTLLLLDNHESHLSVETLNLAKDNGVVILTLPPHCSNKLQPLDVSVFGPFKTYYNSALDSWMMTNPGIPVTLFQIAECVGHAFDKSMTPNNIKAGFKKCGIVPFDRHVFGDDDFLMSSVTDREEPLRESQQEVTVGTHAGNPDTGVLEAHASNADTGLSNGTAEKNISATTNFKTPEELFGYPKAKPRKTSKPRKRGKSMIATDTPEKLEIEKKFMEKKRSESLKKAKGTKRTVTDSPGVKPNQKTLSSSESDNNSFTSDSSDAESFNDLEMNQSQENLKPVVNSYVLIEFHDKKSVFFVGKIIEKIEDDFKVSFLRHSIKQKNSFIFPAVEDVAYVKKTDMKCLLTANSKVGSTKRQQSFINFGVSFDGIDIR